MSSFGGEQAVAEGNTLMDANVDEYWEVLEHSEGYQLPELKTDGRPKGSSFVSSLVVVNRLRKAELEDIKRVM
jgi:hypothetical protein